MHVKLEDHTPISNIVFNRCEIVPWVNRVDNNNDNKIS